MSPKVLACMGKHLAVPNARFSVRADLPCSNDMEAARHNYKRVILPGLSNSLSNRCPISTSMVSDR